MRSPAIVHFTDQTGRERRLVLRLDADAVIPRFEQVRAQISVMVAVGRLAPGCRLPTVRDLAGQLGLAPGTVARTYRELEHDGVVEGRGRRGTFVVDEPPHSEPLEERRERIESAARRYAFDLRQLGADREDAHSAIDRAITALADSETHPG